MKGITVFQNGSSTGGFLTERLSGHKATGKVSLCIYAIIDNIYDPQMNRIKKVEKHLRQTVLRASLSIVQTDDRKYQKVKHFASKENCDKFNQKTGHIKSYFIISKEIGANEKRG